MSISTADSVLAQLAFLGLDDVALHRQLAEFEIDRFDHWVNATDAGADRLCTCTGTYKADDLSMQAA